MPDARPAQAGGANVVLRSQVLAALGASPADADALLGYNANGFHRGAVASPLTLPLPDEPFCSAWAEYEERAKASGVLDALRVPLVQLRFPVSRGISNTEAYVAATRRGVMPETGSDIVGAIFQRPDALALSMHASPAGRIPVISTGDRRDFVTLIQALLHRGEPVPVPTAMGACMVAGFNNWDRISALRARWQADHPDDDGSGWAMEFRRMLPDKALYQDRFMLLSDGPYSAVPAGDLGLSEDDWRAASLAIRREHECTHYFTRRVFGAMNERIMDELMADCLGIMHAVGRYRADWFLRFMGLEEFPRYRTGGRLENYRGDPELSDAAFMLLQQLVKRAADQLERFTEQQFAGPPTLQEKAVLLMTLAQLTLEELASEQGLELLAVHTADVQLRVRADASVTLVTGT